LYIGRPGVVLPELPPEHKFIRGNHDDPKFCREHPNYLGNFGYLPDDELFFVSGAQTASWRVLGNSKYCDISLELPSRLPANTEILLFRVLQESLTNIHRHSGGSRAKIRAGIAGEAAYLEVTDYGRGISQEMLESFKTTGNGVGVGLAGIRERLREVDGKLDLSSTADGTILRVSLPVTDTRESKRTSAAAVH